MKEIKFDFKGHNAVIIVPDSPAEGRPWIWRTEFLYAFNQADMALVEAGYHEAYCQFCDEYGSNEATALFKEFHDFVVSEYELAHKASLFGFSRGALYAINYALGYPDDVSSLYLDAPVIDLRSWPGGFWNGIGSPAEWEDCKNRVLGIISDDETDNLPVNPIHRLNELADTGIPVLLIAGGSDKHVPYEENGLHLEKTYTEKGKDITVIIKPECEHHPHSLDNVAPIVKFVTERA